jgi:hypothetical protein
MPFPDSPPEQLAYATVRIETCDADGNPGTGTGFFFDLALSGPESTPVIVTNNHVVENSVTGRFVLTVRSHDGPIRGSYVTINIPNFAQQWIPHPDNSVDICVMPIGLLLNEARAQGREFFFTILQSDLLPTEGEIEDYAGLEEIVMVGYPQGLWDNVNNQPIFRRGILASDYRNDWKGKKECLIDAACFPGSSGSPVIFVQSNRISNAARYPYRGREN